MQETANKQKRMTDEMDIKLEVFNLETDFFGDLHCSSRFTDMLCDAQAQYGDYSELDECPVGDVGEGRGTSTSGITEIGNYGHTEKPEGRYDGYTEGLNNGM